MSEEITITTEETPEPPAPPKVDDAAVAMGTEIGHIRAFMDEHRYTVSGLQERIAGLEAQVAESRAAAQSANETAAAATVIAAESAAVASEAVAEAVAEPEETATEEVTEISIPDPAAEPEPEHTRGREKFSLW